ncbi:hypothetical protein KOR42_30220 [Thalassoglobus neptunius]|uniref:Uncharacterized protein n=2 Tax=Thalassoglobus neptunius TaxID=1938619 RepID=A0A5C5WND5_9PLAN|nr:hypothetical protein KOR42_30220 [Thalassoglobus neptunius]
MLSGAYAEEPASSTDDPSLRGATSEQRREVIQHVADSANRLGTKIQNGQFGPDVLDEQKRVLELIRQLLSTDSQTDSLANPKSEQAESTDRLEAGQSEGEPSEGTAEQRPESSEMTSNDPSNSSQGGSSEEPTDGATGHGAGQGPAKEPAAENWSPWQRATLEDAVWGHLPPQERRQLSRTYSETFLPGYEDQVKAYFERLTRLGTRAAESRTSPENSGPRDE